MPDSKRPSQNQGVSIYLLDWSGLRSKQRYALFCVAYMMLDGRGRQAACDHLGPLLKINRYILCRLSRHYIKTPQTKAG